MSLSVIQGQEDKKILICLCPVEGPRWDSYVCGDEAPVKALALIVKFLGKLYS